MTRLRFLLTMAPMALLTTSACAGTHDRLNGSVSYTSTPPSPDLTGALPLAPLYCKVDVPTRLRPNTAIQLGSKCVLAGRLASVRGAPAPPGFDVGLTASGVCELPTATGTIPVTVNNTTFGWHRGVMEIMVGATAADGRYFTWRFTGSLAEKAPRESCDAVLQTVPDRAL